MNHTSIAAALRQIADALDENPVTPEAPVIAQPKLPEGYNPHRPGDPCPINPETPCHVAFRDGTSSEQYRLSTPIKAGKWNWRDDDNDRDIIGYKIVPSPEQPKEEPKPEWPWKPEERQEYYTSGANHGGDVSDFTWCNDGVDKRLFALGDVYRTEEEAQARAELNKRLVMTARLRQLGGGDGGSYIVSWDEDKCRWRPCYTSIFAPGEARFPDKQTAQAAIETLRAAGLLPESWQ